MGGRRDEGVRNDGAVIVKWFGMEVLERWFDRMFTIQD